MSRIFLWLTNLTNSGSAESLAEFTKRPLYMVSSGELGTTPSVLEDNLAKIMKVATVWKAVLLLDEVWHSDVAFSKGPQSDCDIQADVFLEKRSLHDITRNALVSIFLRLLEYYQG